MRQIIKFLQEVRSEFKNISWPKRESLIQLTIVVISISLIVSLILGGFDFLFTQGFNLLSTSNLPAKPPIIPEQTATQSANPLPLITNTPTTFTNNLK